MKRVFSVVAIVLLLMATMWCSSSARMRPYGYLGPYQGDDHTWGGETEDGTPPPVTAVKRDSGFVVTGMVQVDVFFTTVVVDWMRYRYYQQPQTAKTNFYVVPIEHQIEGDTDQNVNSRGR